MLGTGMGIGIGLGVDVIAVGSNYGCLRRGGGGGALIGWDGMGAVYVCTYVWCVCMCVCKYTVCRAMSVMGGVSRLRVLAGVGDGR